MNTERTEVFDEYRPLMFSIAYRMLGTVMEAEDILQEAFLRWEQAAGQEVESPKAYLSTVVTRLCIDHLRSARVKREEYIGPWLPEPMVTDTAAIPAKALALSESLSMALLVILESLTPEERAVFLLREAFDYDYPTIASIVDKSEANCRQMVSRARKYVAERRPRFEVSSAQQARVVDEFVQTVTTGNVEGLLAVLDDDVTWWSDGGGKAIAARKPIQGAQAVAQFALNLMRMAPEGMATRLVEINGAPGLINYVDGVPINAFSFAVVGGRIAGIYAIVNPDKLQGLPPIE